jgi:hypothetical protein
MSNVSLIKAVRVNGRYYRTVESAKFCLGVDSIAKEDCVQTNLLAITYYDEHDWEHRRRHVAFFPMGDEVSILG